MENRRSGDSSISVLEASAPADLSKLEKENPARDDDEEYEEIVRLINRTYQGPIEGFDWDEDTICEKMGHYFEQLKADLPDGDDEDFWAYCDETQLQELHQRLALYRIRALKV